MEKEAVGVEKPTFGSTALMELLKEVPSISSITFLGLCTDICVISNVLLAKANFPEVPINVYSTSCAGVTPQSHQQALEAMKMCQVNVVE